MKKLATHVVLGLALLAGGAAFAKAPAPAHNVSAKRHPNLAAAQKALGVAFDKITAAQKANEYDLAGHAAKAKELIDQAAAELKLAAEQANENAAAK
jgi:hypothetical protein